MYSKKLILFVLLISFAVQTNAQLKWQWAKESASIHIATDSIGEIYTSYRFKDSIKLQHSIHTTPNGETHILNGKYTVNGDSIRVNQYHTAFTKNEHISNIATDNKGQMYTTGIQYSNGGIALFIKKYNSLGHLIWKKNATVHINSSVSSPDIAVDKQGNVYVTGPYKDTGRFDNSKITCLGAWNSYLVKYDASGNLIWLKSFGGTQATISAAIALDSNNDVYLTGQFVGDAKFDNITLSHTNGFGQTFVAKYANTGNIVWANSTMSANRDLSNDIVVTKSGDTYITGTYVDSVRFGNTILRDTSVYKRNIYLAKYNNAGQVVWAIKTGFFSMSGSGFTNISNHVTKDNSGNIYVSGVGLNGGFDIESYNQFGNQQWKGTISQYNNNNVFLFDMETGSDNSIIVSGRYNNSAKFGDHTINNNSVGTFFAKLAPETESVSKNYLPGNVSVYPNPTTGTFTINTNNHQYSSLSIYNQLGKLVYNQTLNHTEQQVDLQQLPKGIYVLQLSNDDITYTQKIILE